jgi:hypothetical protein
MLRRRFTCHILLVASLTTSVAFAGPPSPLPYQDIPDPADGAVRHISIKAEDRGEVWLYTGILNCWHPDQQLDMLKKLKLGHWRSSWPFWYPRSITTNPKPKWNDPRDSAVYWAKRLDTMLKLREEGMSWQVLVHHTGPYYDKYRIQKHDLKDFYDHIYTLVKYMHQMGVPVDYWEICNEPGVGPHEGIEGYTFRGTWPEFLGHWDTAYDAIRAAHPQAKIVGPSYGSVNAKAIEPFLIHCKEKKQTLDVLSWHEISQNPVIHGMGYKGANSIEPDKAHKNIDAIRTLVDTKYPMLGVKEIHIDEWGYTVDKTGPGTQIAYFYYFDQAGVDRAAKAHWTQGDLDGILVSPRTPRTSYWAWVEYAKQKGGVRLVTQTNDRCVVALASGHDNNKTVRAVIARSKRDTGEDFSKTRPPVKTVVDFHSIKLDRAEVTIIKLGPHDGPLWEEDLEPLTTKTVQNITDGQLTLTFDKHAENQVYAVTLAPIGTWASDEKTTAHRQANQQASKMVSDSELLPHVVFKEDFENGFESGKSIFGKHGWTHAKNKTSYTTAINDKAAHSGQWSAQFVDNYWSNHTMFQPIVVRREGVVEASAWFRFPDYKGNADGHGFGAMNIGLYETADSNVERNYVYFKFGTHDQNGYSVVIFNNDGARRVEYTEPSGVRHDVRGKWHQISVVLDYITSTLTCRHREDESKPWQVFLHRKLNTLDWTPKFLHINAFNQRPDWRFKVDDIEVRSSIAGD